MCTSKNLFADTSLDVTKPDKGHGVVLLNRNEYIVQIMEVLSDTSTFFAVVGDWLKLPFQVEKAKLTDFWMTFVKRILSFRILKWN